MRFEKWNRVRLANSIEDAGGDVAWAQEYGLLPKTAKCPKHRKDMSLLLEPDRWGRFRCWKAGCNSSSSVTSKSWFENSKIDLKTSLRSFVLFLPSLLNHPLFSLLYSFSNRETYDQAQRETMPVDDDNVVSTATVADW